MGRYASFFYPFTDGAEEKAIKEIEANNSQLGYNFWATNSCHSLRLIKLLLRFFVAVFF